MTPYPYIHLRLQSSYSLAEGAIKIKRIAELAKKNNMPSIALTDNNNLFGALEFSLECVKNGIQPIIGSSLNLLDIQENHNSSQINLLVKNKEGYKNLLYLSSISHTKQNNIVGIRIEDLLNHKHLLNKNYDIVHYDSPDERGIDVGLIYNKNVFKVNSTKSHELIIYDNKSSKRNYTRDQLVVSGLLDGELIHIIVNHWPSRSGGEERSRAGRMAAAELNKKIIDSLQNKYKNAKIITMGDFNDDPHDDSMKKILNAKKYIEDVKTNGLYNPMEVILSDQGIGSNAYRDVWQLFDQILVTEPFLNKKYDSYQFYKAGIFNKSYLTQKKGRYKGQPFRSFSWGRFTNGYSDHYPSFIYLIKQNLD